VGAWFGHNDGVTSSTAALSEVLGEAVRVRVTSGGATDKGPLSADVLADVRELPAVRGMIEALAVARVTDGGCMCLGDLAVEFFAPGRRRLAVLGLHHGTSVRWSGWSGDADLVDGYAPLRWLAGQGCPGPLAGQQAIDRRLAEEGERSRLAEADWRGAAPAAVADLLDTAITGWPSDDVKAEVARRLREAIADEVERAAVTLAWYGSGTGRCSGFPAYEALPDVALRELPIDRIIEALQAHPGDAAIEAGAIRHLCGWKTRAHQADDVARIPTELRHRLLEVARQSTDHDRRNRAEARLR
jgi:hypothetical protein